MYCGRILLLLALLAPTGCSYAKYGIRNVFWTPIDVVQDRVFRARLCLEAHKVWREVERNEGTRHSHVYEEGFEAGFVDYVDANGDGEPPPRAPKHLRWRLLATDGGQADIEEWFNGFRHGARIAREQGLRERLVTPVGQEPRPARNPMPAQVVVPISPQSEELPKPIVQTSTNQARQPGAPMSPIALPRASPQAPLTPLPISRPDRPPSPKASGPLLLAPTTSAPLTCPGGPLPELVVDGATGPRVSHVVPAPGVGLR